MALLTTMSPDSAEVVRRASKPRRMRRALRWFGRRGNELRSIIDERLKRPSPKAWPVYVNVQHTSVCNLRCIMCPQGFDTVPQEIMDLEVYRRIRGQAFEHASELSLSVMGDPFCVPAAFLEEILDDVEWHGLRLEITTNATLLGKPARIERIARLTTRMIFSIDASSKEVLERVRVGVKWEQVVGQIEAFRDACRRLPLWDRPLVCFNYVVMNSTLEDLPHFLELAHEWGGHEVRASPLNSVDTGVTHESLIEEELDFSSERVREVLRKARRIAERKGVVLRLMGGLDAAAHEPVTVARRLQRVLLRGRNLLRTITSQGVMSLAEKTQEAAATAIAAETPQTEVAAAMIITRGLLTILRIRVP